MKQNRQVKTAINERISIWSIRPRARHTFYTVFCTLILGVACMEVAKAVSMIVEGSIDNDSLFDTVREVTQVVGEATAPVMPVLVAGTLAITELLEYIMVLSERLFENLQKVRESRREEGREEGRAEVHACWQEWDQMRREAERRGEPFDTPPPSLDDRADSKPNSPPRA